jgi:hypothetical protein
MVDVDVFQPPDLILHAASVEGSDDEEQVRPRSAPPVVSPVMLPRLAVKVSALSFSV